MQPVIVTGKVTPFKGNGRKFGYPTANISTSLVIKDGVYFGFADLDDYSSWPALIFIGVPTTVGDTERRIEAHLLDIPDQDYYGLALTLQISHFHRTNQTFASVEDLMAIMRQDESTARAWFEKRKTSSFA